MRLSSSTPRGEQVGQDEVQAERDEEVVQAPPARGLQRGAEQGGDQGDQHGLAPVDVREEQKGDERQQPGRDDEHDHALPSLDAALHPESGGAVAAAHQGAGRIAQRQDQQREDVEHDGVAGIAVLAFQHEVTAAKLEQQGDGDREQHLAIRDPAHAVQALAQLGAKAAAGGGEDADRERASGPDLPRLFEHERKQQAVEAEADVHELAAELGRKR
jgi:hypothetical protein